MSEMIHVTVDVNPDEIKAWAEKYINAIPAGVAHVLFAAGDFYSGMSEEVEYRIVDPDTNGGRYELRRWARYVTEWSTDE